MVDHAAILQAIRAWFHSAHHVTRGSSFHGDHEIYSEVYLAAQGYFDVVVEKTIGLTGFEEIASPAKIVSDSLIILRAYPDPVSMSSLAVATTAKKILEDYCAFLKELSSSLEEDDSLTLGTDDFLAATANAVETFVYKLGQRIKTEIKN